MVDREKIIPWRILRIFPLRPSAIFTEMAIYDEHFGGYRIFVGDLGRTATRYDVETEFGSYGQLLDVWVAR